MSGRERSRRAKRTLDVLLIEDNPGDARLFEELLEEGGQEIEFRWERTLAAGFSTIEEAVPDVIALDLELPDSKGIDTIARIVERAPALPVVVLTGQQSIEQALTALEAGATEYLRKDELAPSLLARTLQWAVERKEMQRDLRARGEQLRSITENISDGIYRSAPGVGLVYANQAFATMFGYERPREILEADPTDLYVDPEVRERLREILHDQGDFDPVEVELRRKDGSTFTGLLSGTVVRNEEGEVEYYDGAVTDVSKQKEVERELRMLSEAVEQARESVLITEGKPLGDPGPRIVYVNRAFEETTGYTEEEVLGETPRVLQGPETEQTVLDSLRDALEAGEPWQGEAVNYRKDGTPYRLQWSLAPVRDEEGETEYWVSVQRDVTEEREREKQMTQMAMALEQVDDKVFITDREGQIQYVNQALKEITGYREEEIVGKTPEVLQSGEHDEAFYEELWETVLSGETFRAEFINEKKDGTRYVEEESISPVTDEEGEITHFVSCGRDITDRKEAEKALQQSEELHRATLSNITDTVFLTQEDGTFSYVCPNVEYIFGYTQEEVEDLGSISVLLGTDPAEEHEFEGEQEISNIDHRVADADGQHHDLLINVRRVVIQDGRRMYTCRDITERKQAEEALQEREAQLRGLANSIPGVVYQFYALPAGTYGNHFVSEHAQSMLGISAEADDFFERVVERIPRTHRDQFLSSVDEAVEQEAPWRHEFPFRHPSGETIWILGASTPERRNGELIFNGVLLDVTERKKAQRALEEREEYLSVMLQSIGDAVMATDRDGCVTEMNSVAERLTGWSKEEAEGKLLDNILTLHSAQTGGGGR